MLLLLVCSVSAHSQSNISVASFRLLENDLTANTHGTMEKDQNGEIAALIKIVTTEKGFKFEGGMVGIVNTKQMTGEVWVYVPHGIKKVSILHDNLGVLRDYYFSIPIEKARTYEMVLTTGKVVTFVERKAEKQYVSFKVSPSNAVVELDDMTLDVDPQGFAEKSVPYGTYDYRVSCATYHTEAGKVTVAEEKVEKIVTLRPNHGWIKFEGANDFHGAHVYVNNERVGQLPLKTDKLVSGTYRVKVVKSLYKTYEQQVVVTDDSITSLDVSLVPNFANITLKTDSQSDIWIDGRHRGRGECTIPLEPGEYTVEVKRPSHRTVSDVVTVSEQQLNDRTVKLPSPTPIYGSLEIKSDPSHATIYVDGVNKGTTAKVINDVLVGSHTITLKKEGYESYEKVVDVKEGETTFLTDVKLSPSSGWIKFEGAKEFHGADVFINDKLVGQLGQLPLTTNKLKGGTYRVKVVKPLYKPYEQNVEVTGDNTTLLKVSLVRNFANITFVTDAQSDIWIGGSWRGKGRCTVSLEPNEYYKVEVKRPSYRTVSEVITISEPLNDRTINLPSPTPAYGSLQVMSVPPYATIYVDGVNKGTTDKVINAMSVGSHKITLKKDGYETYEETVDVEEGKTAIVIATLSPKLAYGSLDITSNPSYATIYVDGVNKGTTPKVISDVPAGFHKIKLVKEGYETYEKTVDVKAGKTTALNATLSRTYSAYATRTRMVDVNITSSPSNATLQVDGKAVGTTPMNLSLKAGKYTFYTSKEGYYPKEIQQEVGPSMSGVHLNMNKIVRNKPSHNKAYKNSLYFEGNAEALMNLSEENFQETPFNSFGGGIAAGYYLGGVNAEVALQLNEEYLQTAFRIGRGYLLGRNMMITPQIGLSSFYDVEYLYDSMELDLYEYEDLCLSFSCRFHYCFSEKVALSITPECVFYSIDEEAFLSRDYYQSTMGLFLRVGLFFNRKW